MNPKKRLLLTFVILLVAGITVIAALIYQNGKGYDEDTNRTEVHDRHLRISSLPVPTYPLLPVHN